MILNRQHRAPVSVGALARFEREIRKALRLGGKTFNVCFIDDREIRKLNALYRGKARPTDVLSFPWDRAGRRNGDRRQGREFRGFLGDIAISAETALRNARGEGHSLERELRWLMLHGVLHLVGYDHETDGGEMTALELSLRGRLGLEGKAGARRKRGRRRPTSN